MDKMDIALQAIDAVFGDTTVDPYKTLEQLEKLQSRIEGFIEALAADGIQ